MRRAIAVFVVLAAAVAAWASTGGGDGTLVTMPTIAVTPQLNGQTGSGNFSISTPGTINVAVDHIAQDAACDDPAINVTSSSGFTVMPGTPRIEVVACPMTATLGMRRCSFHADDATNNALTSWMEVCQSFATPSLALAPSQLTFASSIGTLSAPQTVTVTNTGLAASGTLQVQIDNDLANDFVIGAPCAINNNGCNAGNVAILNGGTTSITVYCKPTVASPPPARLFVSIAGAAQMAPVMLSCTGTQTGGATLSVTTTPSPLDLGSVEASGTNFATGTVHLKNSGTQLLTVSQIAISQSGTDWSYTVPMPCNGVPCDIAPGASQDVTVKFDPTTYGTLDATMQIMSNATNGQQSVSLSGTGLGATLELDPSDPMSIDFGFVPKNGSSTLPIHLINRGNRDLTDATITLSPTTGYSVTPPNPVTVMPSAPTTAMLTCSPNGSTSTLMTTFTASAPDTVTTTPVVVTATCTGTDAALVATPSSINFGELRTGDPPVTKTIMLENVSSSPLTLQGNPTMSPAVPALTLSNPSTLTIAAHSSVPIMLTAATTSDADLTTTISATDDVDSGYTLQIPVIGKVATASVMVPSTVMLGTFCVNQETSPVAISLMSTGTAKIKLPNQPAMMLAASSPFTLSPKQPATYPAVLAPSESATVDVKPKRTSTMGPVMDDVVWSTDVAGDLSPHTTVSAMFLNDGAAIAPAELDFGQVAVHVQPHDAMPVTIQNCSDSAISLTANIDQPFSFDNTEFPTSLMPGQTATFTVSFTPPKITHYEGHLHITTTSTTQPALDVKLVGDGIAGDMGGDAGPGGNGLGPTSFYACSCHTSRASDAWPFALVALLMLRRRRGSSSAR